MKRQYKGSGKNCGKKLEIVEKKDRGKKIQNEKKWKNILWKKIEILEKSRYSEKKR